MITKKQFMKALKKKSEAELLISQYNLQECLNNIEIFVEAGKIADTFQNGSKSESQCFSEACLYLKKQRDEKVW